MKKLQKRSLMILALGIFVCSAYLLATASPLLLVESARFPGLPMGSLITWAGIASLPIALFLGFDQVLRQRSRLARVFRSVMTGLLLLSAGWGFVSYGLAGNWAFNFSNQTDSFQGSEAAGKFFWAYSISIVTMTLLVSAVLCAFVLFSNRKDDRVRG
jgi:hypothetical protein